MESQFDSDPFTGLSTGKQSVEAVIFPSPLHDKAVPAAASSATHPRRPDFEGFTTKFLFLIKIFL
jgi:hypothetical protein